ncbi:hypothetical protein [Wolbachia endosymbiont (group B) of Limnophora tigrina]|uniref:hypothetical protein n=1 Tax=Wolbachia endosymbiont (group B) of Limnophora tigrina TaxID=3139317 RepID=UPI0035B52CC1
MVFVINGECDMALLDNLNGKTKRELIDDSDFVNALLVKLKAGANDNGVYTKKDVDAKVVKKADVDGANATEAGVNAMLGILTGNNVVVKVPDLTTKVNVTGDNATEAGVNAMLGTLTGNNVVVKVPDLTTKVNVTGDNATEAGVNTMLGTLTGNNVVVKADGSNATEDGAKAILSKLTDKVVQTSQLETSAVAGKVLGAKDGNKSILVEKLRGFLDANDTAYGDNQTAKAFLSAKVGASIDDVANKLAGEESFKTKVIADTLKDLGFQNAVKEVMSQPYFEPPINDDAALNWTW